MIFYFCAVFIISNITPHKILTPLIVYIILICASIFFAKKTNYKINSTKKTTFLKFLIRTILTIILFLIVTKIPQYLDKNLAGTLSSFPVVLLPLLCIIHFNYGNTQAKTVVKNMPFGLTSVICYSISLYFTYNIFGIFIGTILSWVISVLFLYTQMYILKKLKINL